MTSDRYLYNAEKFTVDLGYAITADGWVVTSDGLPRGSFDEEAWIEQFGHPIRYRKPTEDELKHWNAQEDALERSMQQFLKGMQ